MPTVSDLLADKGSDEVLSISRDATVLEAARLMNQHKIGALVVTDEAGKVDGIFTERDVLRRVVADQKDPGSTKVGSVMTQEVACCGTDTSVDDARSVMKNRRIRHLPIVGPDRQLHGIISIGDINAYHTNNQEVEIKFLQEYLYGRT